MLNDDSLYFYRIRYLGNYDGDTIRCDISLGFDSWLNNKPIRLYGINAPELRGGDREKGLEVKHFVEQQLSSARQILLKSHKDSTEKYGRYLGTIYYQNDDLQWFNLNELLIEHKMVVAYP